MHHARSKMFCILQGDAGSMQLARALKEHTNEKLVEVDIGYNEIKDEGACALAQVRCTCIERESLRWCIASDAICCSCCGSGAGGSSVRL
jgi:hypothetical protein